jgi:hypothetical protein
MSVAAESEDTRIGHERGVKVRSEQKQSSYYTPMTRCAGIGKKATSISYLRRQCGDEGEGQGRGVATRRGCVNEGGARKKKGIPPIRV